jgi:cytochrome c553
MQRLLPMMLALVALATTSIASHAQDAKAGAKKAAMCIGCHGIEGYQSSFPEVHKVPMISGQNAKYIASSLAAYKKGERKHPTMRAIASSLSDQDMADLGAYYESHIAGSPKAPEKPAVAPSPQVAELLKKANCASCHGENLSRSIDPGYPKLAGQHADYLYFALKAYQTEKNPHVGRANPIMMGMAKPFTLAEIKQLAKYISSLPGELKVVPQSRIH